MSDVPEIAALLTVHNRAHLLPRVLDGLVRQRLSHRRFEVIAVDDGSTDQTPSVLESYQDRLPLRIVRQASSGLAAAKNLGIFISRAPILVFMDDDDVADPELLLSHLAMHLRHRAETVAVLGFTDLDPAIAGLPVMRHVTGVGGQLFSQAWMRPGQVLTFREFWGGRSSCKRSFLTEHGVFHPAFRFGCEDIELGFRLDAFGLRVIHEPAARTTMIRPLSFDDVCRRSIRQGRSQWLFARLHDAPAVREYCEIDRALALWPSVKGDFAAILRRAEGLDRMMRCRGPEAHGLAPAAQTELDDAYREAFLLCRAKGIADAASLPQAAYRPQDYDAGRVSLAGVPLSVAVTSLRV
ncbi:MAG: glycosyltransferase family 2 protein [Proteobacteria bacterium]|nr:glycosyltransferase family 2 protein [Pseudomonadota bacterium]